MKTQSISDIKRNSVCLPHVTGMTTCSSYCNTRSANWHSFRCTANKSLPLPQQQWQEKLEDRQLYVPFRVLYCSIRIMKLQWQYAILRNI